MRVRTARVVRPMLLASLVMSLAVAVGCSNGAPKLAVTGLHPSAGPYVGGDPVSITGSGFQTPGPQGMEILFGGKKGRGIILVSDKEIRVEPPAGEIGATVDVEIVFDDARSAKLPNAYSYMDPIGKTPAPQ